LNNISKFADHLQFLAVACLFLRSSPTEVWTTQIPLALLFPPWMQWYKDAYFVHCLRRFSLQSPADKWPGMKRKVRTVIKELFLMYYVINFLVFI
jgi:hypothetical protein